jgi:hypothetical protein
MRSAGWQLSCFSSFLFSFPFYWIIIPTLGAWWPISRWLVILDFNWLKFHELCTPPFFENVRGLTCSWWWHACSYLWFNQMKMYARGHTQIYGALHKVLKYEVLVITLFVKPISWGRWKLLGLYHCSIVVDYAVNGTVPTCRQMGTTPPKWRAFLKELNNSPL